MPEIRGFLNRYGEVQGDCLLCERPSTSRMVAPGIEGSPEVPLHVLCAARIVRAYGLARSGLPLPPGLHRMMSGYAERVQQIGAGHASQD